MTAMKTKLICLILAMFQLTALAQRVKVGNLYYNLSKDSKTAEVAPYDEKKYEGNITIPASVEYEGTSYQVTKIADNAFWDCGELTAISIPNTVWKIGESAFLATQLKQLALPASVTEIGTYAFTFCPALMSITVDSNNKVYDSRNQCNAIIHTATDNLLFGCNATVIPSGVKKLSDSCFEGCVLMTQMNIPYGVKSIGRSAFSTCKELTSVTIPGSVTSIGGHAFEYCQKLTSLIIPEGVSVIEEYLCIYCESMTKVVIPSTANVIEDTPFHTALQDVYCYATTPPRSKFGYSVTIMPFAEVGGEYVFPATLHVPEASVDAYKNSTAGWEHFYQIVALTPEEMAINKPWASESHGSSWYTIDGRPLYQAPASRGIYIRKSSDGTTQKILIP